MALAVEWLPEEWPDGTPSVKQLLVVALLTTSILLLFRTEIIAVAGCGQMPVVHLGLLPFPLSSWRVGHPQPAGTFLGAACFGS